MRLAVALSIALAATTLHAGSVIQKIHDQLGQSSDLLSTGKYAEALKLDDTILDEMQEHLMSGDATTQFLCIAIVHKALANAGLGNEDEALWYWDTAVSLYPAFLHSDMSAYGKAGELLKAHPPAPFAGHVRKEAKVTKPVLVSETRPKFPNEILNNLVDGPIVVEVVVGADGKLHSPRVIDSLGAPTLAFATLEAMRKWRFTPGTIDDVPAAMPYRVTMNYKILR